MIMSRIFWCQTVILVSFLLTRGTQVISAEDAALADTEMDGTLSTLMDTILEDLTEKYKSIQADEFWHPYAFGTGNVNREGCLLFQLLPYWLANKDNLVESMDQHHIPGEFLQWKMAELGLKRYLVGLTVSTVDIFDSQLQKTVSTDLSQSPKSIEVFTRWDFVQNMPAMVILVATNAPGIVILKSTGQDTKEIGTFPLHTRVKSLMVSRVSNSEKIVVVPENNESPIVIYNIEISEDGAQIWFFQRLLVSGYHSAIVHQPDTIDSVLIIAKDSVLTVYRFDEETGQFNIQQALTLQQGCSNMLPFTMMYQHYIGCVADAEAQQNVHFISYNYNMNEYEEKDSFEKITAADIFPVAVEGSRDDLLLLQRDSDGAVNIMTYDGQKQFKLGRKCSLDACSEARGFSNGASFVFDDATALVLPTFDTAVGAPVIVFFTDVMTKSSPVFEQSLGLFGEFQTLSQKLNLWRHIVSSAESTLARKLNVEGDNVITGNWQVQSISTDQVSVEGREGRATNSEKLFYILKFGDVNWTEEDFASTNDEIMAKMSEMDTALASILGQLDDAVLANAEEEQVLSGTTLMQGRITANNAKARSFAVTSIWGENSNEFFDSLAHKGQNVLNIEGGLKFTEHVSTERLDTSRINDVLVDDLASLSADNVFQCSSTFDNLQTLQNIDVSVVNDHNLAESVVWADDVKGLHFTDGIVAYRGAETMEKHAFEDVLLSSVSQTIKSPVEFDSVEVSAPVSVGLLNNAVFTSFLNSVVTKDHQGKITGTKTLLKGANLNSLFVGETWNGMKFPEAFVSTSDPAIVLNGIKSFSKITSDKVSVDKEVDGIDTANVVSLSDPEVLHSVWNVKGKSKIFQNIDVDNVVDGIPMESLLHTGTLDKIESIYSPDADVIFEQPVQVENINVHETINGKSFNEIFSNLILFTGVNCMVPGKTKVVGDAVFSNMDIQNNMINGFSIQNFLTKNTPQDISNDVVITETASFQKMYALEQFDSIRIQDVLEKALRVTESTVTMIPWSIEFESIQCQDNFRVEGPINGMGNYGQSVARTRGISSQTFTGPIATKGSTFKNLTTVHLSLDEGYTLQTLDVTAWKSNRAKLSEPASFTKPFSVNNMVASSNMETQNVNGVSVEDIQNQVFRSDRAFQEFAGPIQMSRGMTVENGDIQFHQNVDGFLLDDVIANGFPRQLESKIPIVINENWQFESLKIANAINVNGKVCGTDLDFLQSDSVKRGEENVQIFGEKSFAEPLQVTGSISSPRINNVNFINNIFLLHEDQTISSTATFNSDVFNDMIEVDSINNLPVSRLSEIYSYKDGQHVVNQDVTVQDTLKTNSLVVSGTTQNQDFNEFLQNTVMLSDSNIAFLDEVTLTNPVFVEGNVQTVTYNGINIDDLSSNIVRLDKDVTLEQPITFSNGIQTQDLINVEGNVDAAKLASNLDWSDLKANAIRIDDDSGQLVFKNLRFEHIVASGPVTLSNLNGISFENFATVTSPQDLGTLKFSRVFMNTSNVDLKGKMGQVDITKEFQDTLMNNRPEVQRISGNTIIRGPVHVKQNIQCFGPQFKDSVVTTHQDLVMRGPIEFTSPLVANEIRVTKPIQGHTVESIFANTLNTEEEHQVISSNWEFRGPVIFKQNVSGEGLSSQKMDIQALIDEKDEELRTARSRVASERQSFLAQCNSLQDIRNDVAESPIKLDSFDLHQAIALRNEAKSILTVGSSDHISLLVHSTNCQIQQYRWQPENQLFHKVIEPMSNIGNIKAWQSISHDGANFVVISKSLSDCSRESGLYFIRLTPGLKLSSATLIRISENEVKSFKVVVDETNGKLMLFTLFQDRSKQLDIFQMDGDQFVQNGILQFETSMERVDVTATQQGFAIMCHNKESVHMYDYSPNESKVMSEASHLVFASNSAPLAMFESFDVVYAVMPESGTTPALIQPTCNFQVMRFMEGSIQAVQKLQIPEVVSATQWSFSQKQFMAFLSKSHGLSIYKLMGLNGFQQISAPYKIFGGMMLQSVPIKMAGYDTPRPFLVVLSPNSIEILHSNVFGDKLNVNFEDLCTVN